ncbi:hypothetical protein [Nocardia niwae]|uniref:Uncharacterized protein n=1 Tax=Nocardia niwae TaxID=626084 RepID=A0ABV2XCH3_9NOCA|nr:hypothetical protein [Nocardia niwae]
MVSGIGDGELYARVREEESASLRSAVGNAVRFTTSVAAVVVVWARGPQVLAVWVPGVDLSTWRHLVLFPLAVLGVGAFAAGAETVSDAWQGLRARSIRRRVDRHPDQIALLVPPREAHMATVQAVRSHRSAAVRRLLWVAVPIALSVGVLVGGVSVEEPDGTRRPAPELEPAILGLMSLLAAVLLMSVALRWRRWHASRSVERWSTDPSYSARISPIGPDPVWSRATEIPALTVQFTTPPRGRGDLRRVSLRSNVIGAKPVQIAYLRLFDNRARAREFLRGAWREFGYVHLLRSAASVSPQEVRAVRRNNSFRSLFVASPRMLREELAKQPVEPLPPGRRRLMGVTDLAVKVRDPAGSYPVRSILCHVSFWQTAVDMLLSRVDYVVLDLAGYVPANAGTRFELQRVIDRFPITKVVFLCDDQSDRTFLKAQVLHHWSRMDSRSPNSGTTARIARIAVTGGHRATTRYLMADLQVRHG